MTPTNNESEKATSTSMWMWSVRCYGQFLFISLKKWLRSVEEIRWTLEAIPFK